MDHKSQFSHVIAGAMFSGFWSGYVINAIEAIKTRTLGQAFNTGREKNGRIGSFSMFMSMMKGEGILSLFRGSFHTCLAGMIRGPITMGLYEYSKI